jgi:hypothetical protein
MGFEAVLNQKSPLICVSPKPKPMLPNGAGEARFTWKKVETYGLVSVEDRSSSGHGSAGQTSFPIWQVIRSGSV